jgi:hypothetical protein
MRIHYSSIYIISDLFMDNQQRLAFRVPKHGITVKLQLMPLEDRTSFTGISPALCNVRLKREVPDDVAEMLACLAEHKDHKSFQIITREEFRKAAFQGTLMDYGEDRVLVLDALPETLKSFERDCGHCLHEWAIRTVCLLRWRFGEEGPHNPIHSTKGMKWSLDGRHWKGTYTNMQMTGSVRHSFLVPNETRTQVARFIRSEVDEPLGHVFLREAWQHRRGNPRSSLVLGYAAAEVGVKHCIIKLVPAIDWLMLNAPTPPLPAILKNAIPEIAGKIGMSIFPNWPSKTIQQQVQKAQEARNKLAHSGDLTLTQEELEEVLLAVRDLLYLLDYFCGHQWALSNVRKSIMVELNMPRKAATSADRKHPVRGRGARPGFLDRGYPGR